MEAYVEGVPNQIFDWRAVEFCKISLWILEGFVQTNVAV
jgi:hypothetical protein